MSFILKALPDTALRPRPRVRGLEDALVTGVLVGLSFEARHGAEAQFQATQTK